MATQRGGTVSIELFAIVGFMLAAYSIVANDAIQTLGTFLASNAQRPWWVLWIFASSIIVAIMLYAWFFLDGDIGFGRLNRIPYPENGVQWWHAVPPLILLFLTRYGIPVSTTFLVLTLFAITGGAATEGVMASMLTKSFLGYVVAFFVAGAIYLMVSKTFEAWIIRTRSDPPKTHWVVFQWLSTGFLWSQWLMQDLANIFVFLPRTTTEVGGQITVTFDPTLIIFSTLLMLLLHAYIFATRGGKIQEIVRVKINTSDIRAATLVDLIFGLILLVFKQWNDIPMSTTWVFLGLLAGRELAVAWLTGARSNREAATDIATDIGRVAFGLVISVILAFSMPWAATGSLPKF